MKSKHVKKLLVEQLRKVPIIQLACERTQVSRAAYYKWRTTDPAFARLADEALHEGIESLNDLTEVQLVSAIKEGKLPAIVFWLRARHKAYSNKLEVGGTIKHDLPLSPEHREGILKALNFAFAATGAQTPPPPTIPQTPPTPLQSALAAPATEEENNEDKNN